MNLLGIFSWFGFVMPFTKRIDLIKNAGFDAVTIWWEDEIDENNNVAFKKEEMPDIVREKGLYLENIHIPYYDCNDLWSKDSGIRNACIERHFSWLEDCVRFKIPMMVMHIIDEPVPEYNDYGMESILKIIKKAEELKIIIAIENLSRPEFVEHLFSEVQSEYMGFCYDSSHDFLYTDNSCEILKRWGHLLVTTHLSDNDFLEDRHWLPGEGKIDWESIFKVFPKETYKGCLTLETFCKNNKSESPEAFLKRAHESIKWIKNSLRLTD